jgi:hypothetical protein
MRYARALALAVVVVWGAAAPVSDALQAQAPAGASAVPNLGGAWTRGRGGSGPGELPLNARGVALKEAIDESLAPMYDCVPATIPHILGDPYNFAIEQRPDRVIIRYEKDAVVRTVWLSGPGYRPATAGDYSVQGYSIGRYEKNQLVVETTKFTFDPGGLEDKPPMVPSSTQKKVTERYSRDGDRLLVEAVMEDPLIMLKPVTFTYAFQPSKEALAEWPECDPAQSRAPLMYIPVNQLKYGIR